MKLKIAICTVAVATLVGFGCETEGHHHAKISKDEAMRIACAQVPGGTVKEGELEKEHGCWIWSFDVATPGTANITEVHVDANTGAVIRKEIETPKAEADEAKTEKKEKKHKKEKDDDDDEKDEKK